MAKEILQAGKSVFYIAAEDNNRRLQERIKKVFMTPPKGLQCHVGLSQDEAIPRGEKALVYLEEINARFKPSCIIIDTAECVLNPSQNNKNYDVSVSEYAQFESWLPNKKLQFS